MEAGRRRKRNYLALLVLAALAAFAAAAVSRIADTERLAYYWVSAELTANGGAKLTEQLEWDFGSGERRGIYRDVPDLGTSDVAVSSRTAPVPVLLEQWNLFQRCTDERTTFVQGMSNATRICIGDPNITISGRHVYTIEYDLDTLTSIPNGGTSIDWFAVGRAWTVPIERAELHLRAPFAFIDPRCEQAGQMGACDIEQIAPGHLRIDVSDLQPLDPETGTLGEAIRLDAGIGAPVDLPAAPSLPDRTGADPSTSFAAVASASFLGFIALAPLVSSFVRRRGRELVWAGSATDAAFGPAVLAPGDPAAGDPRAVVKLDAAELAELATIEFVPPANLEPWQGGIVDKERPLPEHQTAWLIQKAIAGEVRIEDEDDMVVHSVAGRPPDEVLDRMFRGRSQVALGKPDADFRAAWSLLERTQQSFAKSSPLWKQRADGIRTAAIAVGVLGVVIGLIFLVISAAIAGREGGNLLPFVIVGAAAIVGVSTTLLVRQWELRVRTPIGSSEWLKVESFRQFLAGSEAHHADWAAEHGILRDYTAWALALGEIDRWGDAVKGSNVAQRDPAGYFYATRGAYIGTYVGRTSAAERSSGSGGGGGFSGGGGGGGGGGSW